MSIKIIKNTMVDPITVKCENCKSVISYTYEDIQRVNHCNIFGTEYVERFIVCPVCKANIDLQKYKGDETHNIESEVRNETDN